MKNKKLLLILIGFGVVGALLAFYISGFKFVVEKEPESLGVGTESFNLVDGLTVSATTTVSNTGGDPVKVLTRNYNRIYGLIQNDSDTDIYLWPENYSSLAVASSTVSVQGGILLVPNGHYEILPENMIITDIWATSTAGNKRILFIER